MKATNKTTNKSTKGGSAIMATVTFNWCDRRPEPTTPSFYYVALGDKYDGDCMEKYFQNKAKAEAYANELLNSCFDGNIEEAYDTEYDYLVTAIIPFDD